MFYHPHPNQRNYFLEMLQTKKKYFEKCFPILMLYLYRVLKHQNLKIKIWIKNALILVERYLLDHTEDGWLPDTNSSVVHVDHLALLSKATLLCFTHSQGIFFVLFFVVVFSRKLKRTCMYTFGKWLKWKISLMGFVYRVVWVLKALWIILSETINILRKLHKTNIFRMPPKILPYSLMYIAPSSGHILLNLNIPFKFILGRFEFFFLISGVRMLYFFEILVEIYSNPPILWFGFKYKFL